MAVMRQAAVAAAVVVDALCSAADSVPCLPVVYLQQDAGMVGYRFNTIGVSDGISMGTDGMSFSLQSRDLIADSIETVMSAQVRQWGQHRLGSSSSCQHYRN